jgi:hypothetical protein
MYIDIDPLDNPSFATALIALVRQGPTTAVRLGKGLYEIGHFSFGHLLPGGAAYAFDQEPCKAPWCENPDIGEVNAWDSGELDCYGVCDSPEQFLAHEIGRWLDASDRRFVVSFTRVSKASQPDSGGWRWHKWGKYIGVHEPQCEYLYNEGDEITDVYVYSVYEKVS